MARPMEEQGGDAAGLSAYRLEVAAEVRSPVLLNEHKGSALRGALVHALRGRFCAQPQWRGPCSGCALVARCPVAELIGTPSPDGARGSEAARGYTVQPPLDTEHTLYERGEELRFGITLYGNAIALFPYVVMGLAEMEREGLGRRDRANEFRRGQLALRQVESVHPLRATRTRLSSVDVATVAPPEDATTHAQVLAHAMGATPGRITLKLMTPTRLTHRGCLVDPGELTLAVLIGRLLERLESLWNSFGPGPLRLDYAGLVALAAEARPIANETRWLDLRSYSTRLGRATPIGGLIGQATWEMDDWGPLLPWLLWGQWTHVGKNAVKGDGWYALAMDQGDRGAP